MGADIELSIEETNKLRAQIGLPLIPVPGKPQKSLPEPKELNVTETNRLRASLGLRPLEYDESKDATTPSSTELPNKATATCPVEGNNTNSDFFYNQVDTAQWLDNVGQKKEKEVDGNEIAPVEGEAEVEVEHDSRALSGLADGEVFTLRDQALLDESNDVLFNATLAKSAKLKQDEHEKKKAARIVFGLAISYDLEEEDVDSAGPIIIKSATIQLSEPKAEQPADDRANVSLFFQDNDADVQAAPIKMKKLKTKRTKQKRKMDDDIIVPPQKMVTTSFNGDEEDDTAELEALFAVSRQRKLKQRKIMSAEDIAHEVKSHLRTDTVEKIDGFIYDNTQDFLDALPAPSLLEFQDMKEPAITNTLQEGKPATATEKQTPEGSKSRESTENEAQEPKPQQDGTDEPDSKSPSIPSTEAVQKTEPTLNSLLDTLRYLRQTNSVSESNERQKLAEKQQRDAQKAAQLAKLQISIEERMVREELERDPQYIKMPAAERESTMDRILNERLVQKGIVSDLKKRGKYSTYAKSDRLADYNPQVKVSYKDEKGNLLNKKQAWKQLLHQYHGLAPKHKREIIRAKTDSEAHDIHPTNG